MNGWRILVDQAMAAAPMTSTREALGGHLRAALNFGNRVLVGRNDSGQPYGITVDLARTIAARLGTTLELVEFERAMDVSASAMQDRWDMCFLAVDPKRADTIAFTPSYVVISGSYLVRKSSGVSSAEQVVSKGLRIGVVEGSAYTLHLSRQAGAENLVQYSDIHAALVAFDTGKIDGIAGIERAMLDEAKLRPEAVVLHPPFMQISQAIGIPCDRTDVVGGIASQLRELVRSGEVAEILLKHGVSSLNNANAQ